MSDNDLIQKGKDDLIRRGDVLAAVQEWTYCCDAEAAINAITAAQPTVKPLVWRSNGKGRVCADTPFGLYEVEHGRYGMRLLHGGSFMQDDLQGIEAAKAAAQADYEACILSVLDMQPTVSPELLATTNDVAALETADDIPELPEAYQPRNIAKVLLVYRAALARVKSKEGFSNEKGVM